MIKNIIIATLVVILLGAVGVGIFDTYQGNSTFEMPNVRALAAGTGLVQGSGQGQGRGQGQGNGAGRGHGQGQGGNPTGEPIVHEWLTLTGTVVEVQAQGVVVNTPERGELLLSLGPAGFAAQQNVTFTAGNAVTIDGFDSPQGQFVAGSITNTTTGQTLLLRDPNGRPLWAGPGRNGQTATPSSQNQ